MVHDLFFLLLMTDFQSDKILFRNHACHFPYHMLVVSLYSGFHDFVSKPLAPFKNKCSPLFYLILYLVSILLLKVVLYRSILLFPLSAPSKIQDRLPKLGTGFGTALADIIHLRIPAFYVHHPRRSYDFPP